MQVRFGLLPLLLLPPLGNLLVLGLLNKAFLASFRVALSFKEWFGLAVVTAFGNFLLPMRGGAGAKALYLKSRKGFPLTTFLSTLGAAYLVNTFLAATIGAGCLWKLGAGSNPTYFKFFLLLAALAIVLLAIMLVRLPSPAPRNRALRLIGSVLEGWDRIRRQPRLLAKAALLLTLNFLAIAVHIQLACAAMSIPMDFAAALTIATALGFTRLISITPANLGIQEGATALLAQWTGLGFNEGLAVALLIRATSTIVIFALAPFFSYLLMREAGAAHAETTP